MAGFANVHLDFGVVMDRYINKVQKISGIHVANLKKIASGLT
jgi:hypothetical protein